MITPKWLIKRFVDPKAEFLFVEERDFLEEAKPHGATPFDAPKIQEIRLDHRGHRCTFEAIIEDHAITDAAIQALGLIARAADIKGQEAVASEGLACEASLKVSPPWGCQTNRD